MNAQQAITVVVLITGMLCPVTVFAKRAAPEPVSSATNNGVEYRAAVWDKGFVEAIDMATSNKLWRTRVYVIHYLPLAETDVQDIFITNLAIQDGDLLVRNEAGKSYRLDLKTGHVRGTSEYWPYWLCASIVGLLIVWKRRWLLHKFNRTGA